MENKKIDLLFVTAVIAFLAVTLFLIKEFNAKRASDYKLYSTALTNVVKQKDNKIKALYALLDAQEKQNADLKNTLTSTRNDLDAISKKLAQPTLTPAPVSVPATATAAK